VLKLRCSKRVAGLIADFWEILGRFGKIWEFYIAAIFTALHENLLPSINYRYLPFFPFNIASHKPYCSQLAARWGWIADELQIRQVL